MVRVPNRGSVRFLNLIIHDVNGEIFGTEKRWSVFQDGPLCGLHCIFFLKNIITEKVHNDIPAYKGTNPHDHKK